jgi:predicted N-acyltransferase
MPDIRLLSSIADIPAAEWNAVCATDYPFIQHAFMNALEQSGAVSAEQGWVPRHIAVYDNTHDRDALIAIMPGYLKTHSYGEFVFDFQWAEAYARNGLHYYPKWISAIPFSPVTGPRLCMRAGCDARAILEQVLAFVIQQVNAQQLSSWHLLFPEQSLAKQVSAHGMFVRKAVHFQWFNYSYATFDDFLAACNSRKRKNIRKERERVREQCIVLERIEGRDITDEQWQKFYHFYQMTYLKRSGHSGYLDLSFFSQLGKNMPDNLLLVLAYKDSDVIAAALYLKDSTTLYGRYWGCDEEYAFLHFETCFYQGIEYCIAHQLQRFDPGAQGEHKIQRGFRPVYTYSNHWIADARFRVAIAQFLQQEEKQIVRYKVDAENYLPFKQE